MKLYAYTTEDSMTSVENVIGSRYDDLTGSNANNEIDSGGSDDVVRGIGARCPYRRLQR